MGETHPAAADAPVTQRVCFTMRLKRETIDEYLRVHSDVWPEVLEALTQSGWRNYSLFLRREDGLVVGYLETDDFALAQLQMSRHPINAPWQELVAKYFEAGRPDDTLHVLERYFSL